MGANDVSRAAPRGNTALIVAGLAVAAATIVAFFPVFSQGFLIYDDSRYITENPPVRAGLTIAGLRWALTSTDQCNWAPLAWLGHMAAVALFGLRGGGHHALSVLAHAATAVLLFLALQRATGKLWPCAVASAIFALHPLRLESVAWAAEFKDPLSGCFAMLTLLAYTRYVGRPTLRRYLPVALFLALGLMVKATLVPFPLLLLTLDYWPFGRWGRGAPVTQQGRTACVAILAEKLPLVMLASAVGFLTYRAQISCGAAGEYWAYPLSSRASNAVVSAAAYLFTTVWPVDLVAFYPHPGLALLPRSAIVAAILLILLAVVALLAARRQPAFLTGLLWYALLLAPVSGIVRAGLQARADRYTYLPLIGVVFAGVWVADRLLARLRLPVAIAAVPALSILLLLTRSGTRAWGDEEVLFRRSIQVMERTRSSGGMFGDAIAASPSYGWPYYALGNVLVARGRTEEALEAYRTAARYSPSSADIYVNMGVLHARRGEMSTAVMHFRAALAINPGHERARTGLAKALAALRASPGS